MTRLLVFSDLHLEHRAFWSLPESFPRFDVAGLAGDVDAPPERAVHRLAEAPGLAGRPIVYVPGNHEFYRSCRDEVLATAKAACAGTRVHLLDRSSAILSGVRFVGATLRTDYLLNGDPVKAMSACRRTLNDHRLVEVGPPGSRRLFQPEDAAALRGARVRLGRLRRSDGGVLAGGAVALELRTRALEHRPKAARRRPARRRLPATGPAQSGKLADPHLRSRYGDGYDVVGQPLRAGRRAVGTGLDDSVVVAWLARHDLTRHDVVLIGMEDL